MRSRERMLAAINHEEPDRVPFYCWCFGFRPPQYLRWNRNNREVTHWYTMRLEHIHTLPQPWALKDDFRRVEKWLSIGLDDVLDVSVPWGIHPDVKVRGFKEKGSRVTEYETPKGKLKHIMRIPDGDQIEGWIIPPEEPRLFEDFNLPLDLEQPVSSPEDIPKLRYLLCGLSPVQIEEYKDRVKKVSKFAEEKGVMVQAWSAFGMDAVVWMCGMEGAIYLSQDHPDAFEELLEIVYSFDRQRVEAAIEAGGVDVIVERGWYSSTDFWSPEHFRKFTLPYLKRISQMVHQAELLFGYVIDKGVMTLMEEILEAGVDLLYFIDPVQDSVDLSELKSQLKGRLAVVGGLNSSVTLGSGSPEEIRSAVREAIEVLSPKGGFILSPVDALYPDTPWKNLKLAIDTWKETC